MPDLVDLAIPRGGEGLIRRVTELAKMPVLKHFDGNCHVYVDRSANLSMAVNVLINAKCQRMGVCNACESLLVHREIAAPFLEKVVPSLKSHKVEIRGDEEICRLVADAYQRRKAIGRQSISVPF